MAFPKREGCPLMYRAYDRYGNVRARWNRTCFLRAPDTLSPLSCFPKTGKCFGKGNGVGGGHKSGGTMIQREVTIFESRAQEVIESIYA